MKSKWMIPGIIIAVVVVLGMMIGGTYNSLVTNREKVTAAASDLQSQYQRRTDLVQQAIGVVKGSSNFEQETLTKLMEARAKATSVNVNADDLTPEKLAQFQAAQTQISSGIGRLLAVVENYPDLKANQNFRDLQAQLEGTENRITVAREQFNQEVQNYNTMVRKFPKNIIAGLFGFEHKPTFEAEKGAEKAPEVKF